MGNFSRSRHWSERHRTWRHDRSPLVDRYHGVVLGGLNASTATGQLLFLPLLANLTVHYGWRVATWAIATVIALAIPFVALFMRDTPRQLGLNSPDSGVRRSWVLGGTWGKSFGRNGNL